jgi:hypothetical protein
VLDHDLRDDDARDEQPMEIAEAHLLERMDGDHATVEEHAPLFDPEVFEKEGQPLGAVRA